MAHLTISAQCKIGQHNRCPGGESSRGPGGEIVYGGWRCICSCHNPKQPPVTFKLFKLTNIQKKILKKVKHTLGAQ